MTRIASIAATLAVVLGALLISAAPANARPLQGFGHGVRGGSCARVMVDAWGACDFPNLQAPGYKAHHCWNPAFRESHPRRCANAVKPDAR
jgi:hypothetical protein